MALIKEHLHNMSLDTPPESVHALGLDELKKPEITFWTVWEQDELLGCGALKELDSEHGEIKSMRTVISRRKQGIARKMLEHILAEAQRRGYRRLSLETGSMDSFAPARNLYAGMGFQACSPFADYTDDPNSVYMTKEL
jgi:putative acetyltransferase